MGQVQIPAAATNQVRLRNTLTSSGTLTIPGASVNNPVTATVVCIGGGAGGSSGMGNTAASWWNNINGNNFGIVGFGGTGGFPGQVTIETVVITGPCAYVIGAGGTGGAASGTFNPGSGGGNTYFGTVVANGGRVYWFNNATGDMANQIANFNRTMNVELYGSRLNSNSTFLSSNSAASANSIFAGAPSASGAVIRGSSWDGGAGSQRLIGYNIFNTSHAGGTTCWNGNSATGGATTAGSDGEAGGTAGGGTAGAVTFGASTASGSSTPYAYLAGTITMTTFAPGGGGGGASGRNDNGAARVGGAGGAATTYGGAGGAGGAGATTTGSGTANGGNASNATGYGSGGGGGGGCATGVTTNAQTQSGGAGGNGAPGVIYIFY